MSHKIDGAEPLTARTKSTALLRSGNTLHHLQSGQVCEVSPPSKHLPHGLWRLYERRDAWLWLSNPIAETRTEPDNAFFKQEITMTPEEDEIYSVSVEHNGNVTLAEAYYQDGKWYTHGRNTEIQGKVTIA